MIKRFINIKTKHTKKRFFGPVILLIVILCLINTPVSAQSSLDKWSDHWAYGHMLSAYNQGWVQFPQNDFNPDENITRAELIRMLEKAIQLMPDGSTAQYLSQISTNKDNIPFQDTSDHWVSTERWLNTALNFGLVLPADYDDNRFNPSGPVTRRECIIMINRAIGRVYPATTYKTGGNLFTDFNSLPQWFKGYVKEAVNYDLIIGYPDGSVKANNNATKAEAITAIDRTIKEMDQGIDSNIKVFAKDSTGDNTVSVQLPVPAQIINNKIYIPARAIYNAGQTLYDAGATEFVWRPADQILEFEYGVTIQYEAGNNYYGFYTTLLPVKGSNNKLVAEARILHGELMIPVIDAGQSAPIKYTTNKVWNENTKKLTITINYPQRPIS